MSTLKTNILDTPSGSGNITVNRPTVLTAGDIITADLADNAVTLAKMAGGTDGQIITYDASGDPVAVGPGTSGQVLTSAGANAPPTFAAAAGGGAFTWISSAVVSSAVASVIVSIDTTLYTTFFLRIENLVPVTDGTHLRALFGDASGIDTGSSDYLFEYERHDTGAGSSTTNGQAAAYIILGDAALSNVSRETISYNIWLNAPTAAQAMQPYFYFNAACILEDGNLHHSMGAGARKDTAITLTQFKFYMFSGDIAEGRFSLYGLSQS